MTQPTVTLAQANRYVLKRQHLLTPCTDSVQAVADACGLQAQVPSTPALSLRCRVRGFARDDYERLIRRERSLVRTWAMRGTIHTLASTLLPMYTRVYAQPEWPTPGMQLALDLLREGPLTRRQLIERAVAAGHPLAEVERLFGPWGGILSPLARMAATVHMPTGGPEVPVIRTEDWLGPQPEPPSTEALEESLLLAYIRGYGPVTLRDMAHFTNFKVGRVKAVVDRLASRLAEVRVEGSRLLHVVPAEDLPELLATTGDEPAPVQLLPRFDSLILAHKDKCRFLDEEFRRLVFREAALVEATVLVNGRVVGTWRMKSTTRELRFTFLPFRRRTATGPVKAEAKRLAKWLGLSDLTFAVE